MTDGGIKVEHVRVEEEYFDWEDFSGAVIIGLFAAVLPFLAGMGMMVWWVTGALLLTMYVVLLVSIAAYAAKGMRKAIRHREVSNAGGKKA
jgi:hypothetical protein